MSSPLWRDHPNGARRRCRMLSPLPSSMQASTTPARGPPPPRPPPPPPLSYARYLSSARASCALDQHKDPSTDMLLCLDRRWPGARSRAAVRGHLAALGRDAHQPDHRQGLRQVVRPGARPGENSSHLRTYARSYI